MIPFVVQGWQVLTGELRFDRVVDLRPEDRYARGHLPGAVHIPYTAFQEEALERLALGETVLVVDAGGARAAEMATWLRARGYQAGYLEGGLAAWVGPLETPRRG